MKNFTLLLLVVGSLLCFSLPSFAQSTAAENVQILDEAFDIPQLNRSRRIWLFLPPGYASSTERFPVLYMHDGQNLFDAETAFEGVEWQVDESLNRLIAEGETEGVIVVGIDHGGTADGIRGDEYAPWDTQSGEGGDGDEYLDFIIETLKPHIDANFRTLPDRKNTGIGGSSLGGLISLYGILRNPDVFGSAAVISPALWFNPEIQEYIVEHPPTQEVRIYMVTSKEEPEHSLQAFEQASEQLRLATNNSELIRTKLTETGAHNEHYYRAQFPEALLWMFVPDDVTGIEDISAREAGIKAYPNPTSGTVTLELPTVWQNNARTYVIDALGRKRSMTVPLAAASAAVSLEALPAGLYYLIISTKDQRVSLPLIKQ